ncbi:hypothetical protein NLG97_g8064 [Lecanicillium saksenae]|uniref:Uncharacterized protein n=1 Tax=Lecanicillium saksenae TaxID=468837 RepID=A0ACC1QNA0_9HYPO|nr:hypothetical protein NLG97_g8064 [Lecanicillium saksenae]
MFHIFLQLPPELRRKIWLATLGPMTLTFTNVHPSAILDRRRSLQGRPRLYTSDHSPPLPYFGHVEAETEDVLTTWNDELYFGNDSDGIGHDWIEGSLHSLRNLTLRINEGYTYSEDNLAKDHHWLSDWYRTFEDFYHPEEEGKLPPQFELRVICPTAPEEEWLTPTNFLRVEKLVHQKMLHFDPQHEERDWGGRKAALMVATDEELDDPAEYLTRRRLARRVIRQLNSIAYVKANPPAHKRQAEEEWDM